jgi:hypothetical protein
LAVIAVACGKDKFQTKPTISIKSINTDLVPANGTFVVTLECTDKEGDVQDSVLIIKKRLNKRVVATIRDTIRYKFPSFPKSSRTFVEATLDYQTIISAITPPNIPGSNPVQKERDTLLLRFMVRDNAGNTSDTISSKQIIVIR